MSFRFASSVLPGIALISLVVSAQLCAETWTDSTGQFRIEAEFVGVKGTSVVLKKPDGSTISVPINRLSAESKAAAKRLYDAAKSGPASSAASATANEPVPVAGPTTAMRPARRLNFDAPAPRTIPAMPPFPENASLQETLDFMRTQLLAGHPEVFWHALPADIRDTLDSDDLRERLVPVIEKQAAQNQQAEVVILKLIEVLIKKKTFVLNSPLMAQVPPPLIGSVQEGYDPAVGALYEIATLSFGAGALEEMTVTQLLDYHGPRIGGHLREIAKLAPPGVIDGYLGQITAQQTSDTEGILAFPSQQGDASEEMVRYRGRWITKGLADRWEANGDDVVPAMIKQLQAAEQDAGGAQQAAMVMSGMLMMANGVLDPMLAAETQQQFDQSIMQIVALMGPGGGGPPGQLPQ